MRVTLGEQAGTQQSLGSLSLPCPAGGAALGDAFVLAGGCAGTGPSARTDVIEPSGLLAVGPALPVALESPAVVDLPGGRALVAGGREALPDGGLAPTARAFILERAGSVVRARELFPMDVARAKPRAVRAGNGWVYVEDAADAGPAWFDPAAERFTPASPPPPRTDATLAGGTGARVYQVGGRGLDGGEGDAVLLLELRCP